MANELTVNLSVAFSKSGVSVSMASGTVQYTISGSDFIRESMTVPTTITELPLGSVATPGYLMIVNRDATNYVDIYDSTTGNMFARLQPGNFAVLPFGAAAPAVKAHTASCKIEYLLLSQ